jgi:DNA-binding NarL/FixJ family response regulator
MVRQGGKDRCSREKDIEVVGEAETVASALTQVRSLRASCVSG